MVSTGVQGSFLRDYYLLSASGLLSLKIFSGNFPETLPIGKSRDSNNPPAKKRIAVKRFSPCDFQVSSPCFQCPFPPHNKRSRQFAPLPNLERGGRALPGRGEAMTRPAFPSTRRPPPFPLLFPAPAAPNPKRWFIPIGWGVTGESQRVTRESQRYVPASAFAPSFPLTRGSTARMGSSRLSA